MFPRQVFGLTGSNLLAGLPKPLAQCRLAFVPAYRCGAVPDFHRIPSSLPMTRDQGTDPLYLGFYEIAIPTNCEYLVHVQMWGIEAKLPVKWHARKMGPCRSSPDWGLLNGKLV